MNETPRVELEAITYSPVAARRAAADYWVECIHAGDLDEAVRRRFTNYALRCYEARELDFYEVEFKTPQGTYLNEKLTRLAKLAVGPGDAERCDITQELAAKLSERMEASGGATVPGAIFLIQARFDGDRHLALVKLDLGRQEVVALKHVAESRHLFSKVFEGALPESAKKFRKAVMVPSPSGGDARSGQFDAKADYWHEFVGAQPLRETVQATRKILDAVNEVLQQEGKVLTEAMGSTILKRAGDQKNPSHHAVARVIKEVTRVEKKVEKIEQTLLRHLGRTTLNSTTMVSTHRYRFLGDKLEFKVPAELVRNGKVSIRTEGDAVVIRILGSGVDRDDIIEA